MNLRATDTLPELYESDETAWLDATAQLIKEGRYNDLDFPHLQEFLEDMAERDRREVRSRLRALIALRLKWDHQPEPRSGSQRATIIEQRQELESLLESGTLRNHASEVLGRAYANGVKLAAAETGLPASTFPVECPYSLENLLAEGDAEPNHFSCDSAVVLLASRER